MKQLSKLLYQKGDHKRENTIAARIGTEKYRSDFRRDYARLIHSPAFRRLQGKTQLFPGRESDFFRNRLTHSLEVAQIAKTIAISLNSNCPELRKAEPSQQIDCDLVEFAALAHDIGHPPFGHNGENALHDCMRNFGGFEGNAQTLRIVSRIEKRLDENMEAGNCQVSDGADCRVGLNLTYRSLGAILKYNRAIPVTPDAPFKKGYYASEAQLVERVWANIGIPAGKRSESLHTVECQIMDVADDIAYSTYDLEDALKAEFLTPLRLLWKIARDDSAQRHILKRVNENLDKFDIANISGEKLLQELQLVFGKIFKSSNATVLHYALKQVDALKPEIESLAQSEDVHSIVTRVFRTIFDDNAAFPIDIPIIDTYDSSNRTANDGYLRSNFTSELVNSFVQGVEISYDPDFPALSTVKLKEATRIRVEILKHATYELIIMSSRQRVVEYRGNIIIRDIFKILTQEDVNEKGHRGHRLLPPDYRWMWKNVTAEADKKRVICDFIACMTDRYAVEFHSRLTDGGESLFKPF